MMDIAFTLGGAPVTWLELASVAAGLLCVFLAGRASKYNFWVGYLYNILLFLLFAHRHLYSAMLLQPVAFGINAFGHWRWSHPKAGEESAGDAHTLRVSRLSGSAWTGYLAAVLAGSHVWGWVLSKLGNTWFTGTFAPDPHPWLDAFMLMVTLLAQFLSAQKKWECWLVWLAVNVGNLVLYLTSGLVFMPIVSLLYLVNGIWSLYTWKKHYRNGK